MKAIVNKEDARYEADAASSRAAATAQVALDRDRFIWSSARADRKDEERKDRQKEAARQRDLDREVERERMRVEDERSKREHDLQMARERNKASELALRGVVGDTQQYAYKP